MCPLLLYSVFVNMKYEKKEKFLAFLTKKMKIIFKKKQNKNKSLMRRYKN